MRPLLAANMRSAYFNALSTCLLFLFSSLALAAPSTPNSITAKVSGTKLTLSWTAVSAATFYNLQFRDGPESWRSSSANYTGSSRSWSNAAGLNNRSYRIRVCNTSGCSEYSEASEAVSVFSSVDWQADTTVVGQVVSITGLGNTVNYCVANGDTTIQFSYDSSASTTTFYSASDIALQSWQCFDGQNALVQEFEAALTIKKLAAPLNLIGQ